MEVLLLFRLFMGQQKCIWNEQKTVFHEPVIFDNFFRALHSNLTQHSLNTRVYVTQRIFIKLGYYYDNSGVHVAVENIE